jgi:glutaminyl-peptide cyclotransferase
MFRNKILFFGLVFLFLLSGCTCNKPNPETSGDSNNPQSEIRNPPSIQVPEFNPDTAYAFIEEQVAFGPRIPGTPAQTKCAAWIESKVKSYHAKVVVQDLKVELWNHQMVPCKNIIASFNPDQKKRILLCTHWDTRPWSDQDRANPKKPFDGADDGGSGVGILLEIARYLSSQPTQVGVDLVFFDVEDYGPPKWDPQAKNEEINGYCIGTQHWADQPHVTDYRAYFGILLDMVGAKNATFPQEGVSLQYAPSIVKKVWDVAISLGYGNYFVYDKAPGITDDHTFVNSINGTPTIDIINMDRTSPNGFAKHWHTQQDNMSIIDKSTLKAVGQTLMQVIYTEPVDAG